MICDLEEFQFPGHLWVQTVKVSGPSEKLVETNGRTDGHDRVQYLAESVTS